jgi:hypothetical protein
MYQLDENWVTIELFSSYLGIGHGTLTLNLTLAKAKAAVNKMKGAVTKATPPSEKSDNMKAKRKTVVGKYSKVEGHNRSR